MRIGLIGTDAVADLHGAALARTPGLDLVAVTDGRERPSLRAREWGARSYRTVEDLLSRGDLDAAWVVSSDEQRIGHALAAVDAGMHVLVGHPVSSDVTALRRLVDVAAATDVVVMPGHDLLQMPELVRMARLADDGALGELKALFITAGVITTGGSAAADGASRSGGALHTLARQFPLSLGLLGTPGRVASSVGPGQELDSEDQAWVVLDHDGGATARLVASRMVDDQGGDPVALHVKLLGTEGSVTASLRSSTVDRPPAPATTSDLPRPLERLVHLAAAFRDAVELGSPVRPTIADQLAANRITDAARESAATGRLVTL